MSLDLKSIRYLNFGGGGVKGFVYLGVLAVLDQYKVLSNVVGASGASIGAFMALCVCSGLRGIRLVRILSQMPLLDAFRYMDLSYLTTHYGANLPQCSLRPFVEHILSITVGTSECTFQEFYTMTQKHLVVSVTNITRGCSETCSHLSTPHVKVADAVVASMSIPLIFAPVQLHPLSSDQYVDGALTNNFPVQEFVLEETMLFWIYGRLNPLKHVGHFMMNAGQTVIRTLDALRLSVLHSQLSSQSHSQLSSQSHSQLSSPPHSLHKFPIPCWPMSSMHVQLSDSEKQKCMEQGMWYMLWYMEPSIWHRQVIKTWYFFLLVKLFHHLWKQYIRTHGQTHAALDLIPPPSPPPNTLPSSPSWFKQVIQHLPLSNNLTRLFE